MARLGYGLKISAVSAVLLFISMFFNWFDVEAHNTSNLLFAVESTEPGKSAWEALEYISIALLVTIVATLAGTALRIVDVVQDLPVLIYAVIAILGLISTLLILFRIVDPPVFATEPTIAYEGAVNWPIFAGLFAAAGIAGGGLIAVREERDRRRPPVDTTPEQKHPG